MPFIFIFTFSHFCGHLVAHHLPLSHSKVGGFVYIYQQGYTYDQAPEVFACFLTSPHLHYTDVFGHRLVFGDGPTYPTSQNWKRKP
jgi:hypothetical protein